MKENYIILEIIIILKDFIDNINDFYIINKNIYNTKIMRYNLNDKYSKIYIFNEDFKNYINTKINSYLQINLTFSNLEETYIKCDANEIFIKDSINIKIRSMNINNIYICNTIVNNITINDCKKLTMTNSTFLRKKFNINSLEYLYLETNTFTDMLYLNNIYEAHILNNINLKTINILNISNVTLLYNYNLIECNIDDNIINLYTDFTMLLCNYKKLSNLSLHDNLFNTNVILDELKNLYLTNCINIDTVICKKLLYFYCNNNEGIKNIKNNNLLSLETINTYIEEINCENLNNLSITYNNNIKEIKLNNLLYLTLHEVENIKIIDCIKLLSINLFRCPLIYNINHESLINLQIEECLIMDINCPNLNNLIVINCHLLKNIVAQNLIILDIKDSTVEKLNCYKLEEMNIDNCIKINEINIKTLKKLSIKNMENILKVNCKNLENISILNCNLDNITIIYHNSIVDLTLNKINIDTSHIEYNNLKKLKICNSNIKMIPKYYKNLLYLTLVNIDNIKSIDIVNLNILYLTDCQNIKTINCPNVTSITIINNVILKILNNIKKLKNLTLYNCSSLEKIDIEKNKLKVCKIKKCPKLL